jgi:hypothetical protein
MSILLPTPVLMLVLMPTPAQINYSLISCGLKKKQVCEMPQDGYPNYLIKQQHVLDNPKPIGNGRR